MKSSSKVLVLVLFFCTMPIFSQFNVNNMSLEAGYGYTGAIKPYYKGFKSNFSGMNHFNVGIRYMFTEKIGAKVSYKFDHFVNDPGGKIGITYNTFSVSGVYNIGKEFGLTYLTRDRLGVNAHVDAGVAFAYIIGKNEYEQVKVVGIGITPMYNISNKIALTADFTHNLTLDQNYGFDGQLVDPLNKKPQSGSFYNFSFGIIYYFGENRYHSDWY
jgi:hypothetical protein